MTHLVLTKFVKYIRSVFCHHHYYSNHAYKVFVNLAKDVDLYLICIFAFCFMSKKFSIHLYLLKKSLFMNAYQICLKSALKISKLTKTS